MTPGPKKKNFPSSNKPRNVDNVRADEKNSELVTNLSNVTNLDSELSSNRKYSKRSLECNWNKYDEKQSDAHEDHMRGNEFEVLLSYSGGSGSQVKLQEEKDWEDDCLNNKEISLSFQDLINAMKCIPFHERINTFNVFEKKHIDYFISVAKNFKENYKSNNCLSQVTTENLEDKENAFGLNSLNIVESSDITQHDDSESMKKFVVPEKTVDIINALASNLTFMEIPEKESLKTKVKLEDSNNDLDFLISLNISSPVSTKAESGESSKAPTVDDWLNSILDD